VNFRQTPVVDAWEIEIEPIGDHRGWFARTFCRDEFTTRGINSSVAQCSTSFNPRRGTLRGLHYQTSPHLEAKLVRCTRGAVFDVAVDLRADSPTFARWVGVTLTADNGRMLYVPEGCGHGFLTLEDNAEVHYQISQPYHPESQRGVRWNDPRFQIGWPGIPEIISDRDSNYPDF